jgi:outer membrane murein-binding lipoprotein Lpp
MFLAILTTLTALAISAVAIYYSIAGLVAIFAAAAVPIMIMGGALEIGKLVTAVWLHKHWKRAAWWLKSYLTVAVVVLMFITSMGIFGFLSKAHIEQTSAGEESVAQVQQIETEISRLNAVIDRADEKIIKLESSGTGADANIQSQIDKEQERIDKAFERIKPAIAQQNKIIEDARGTDAKRTKPYEDQLASITAEILRLETSAKEYESKIENLDTDNSGVEPLLAQIDALEQEIIRVTNQLQSTEKGEIRAGQAIIGVSSDGLFGGNTRTALAKWVQGQRDRITQIQGEVAQVRKDATATVDAERIRLAEVVKDIRTVQIPALKTRELTMLGKIDGVRQTESPVIQTARDEIQRLRKSAEDQVVNSQALIERLRGQLAQTDKAVEIDAAVDEQLLKIKTAEAELDTLTEEKYSLQAEYRKLEAEVGPIKYIAEFVYGESADNTMLEEAVRWVILIIIFVFDPLAVLLLIASQYTFEWNRSKKEDDFDWNSYERKRAEMIVANPGYPPKEEEVDEPLDEPTDSNIQDDDVEHNERDREADDEESLSGRSIVEPTEEQVPDSSETQERTSTEQDTGGSATASEQVEKDITEEELEEILEEEPHVLDTPPDNTETEAEKARREDYDAKHATDEWKTAKEEWKAEHPNETLKEKKLLYIKGLIDELPWEANVDKGYEQNAEQGDGTLFNKLRKE